MKKGLSFLLILIMSVLLAACGSSIPKGMSEKTYNYGTHALEIMEKYNSAEISKEEADKRLNDIKDQLFAEDLSDGDMAKTKNLIVTGEIVIFISGRTIDAEENLRNDLGK